MGFGGTLASFGFWFPDRPAVPRSATTQPKIVGVSATSSSRAVLLNSGEVWLSSDEVAARLKIPKKTLAVWASTKRGPRYARIGRFRRYRLVDVVLWEQEQIDKVGYPEPTGPVGMTDSDKRRPPIRKRSGHGPNH
ncbi:helix-turn-helix domain-containing protein [Nocardia sp. NPDC057030]|uniref:helix-turn-helix domain-containing protein n=1 Tax=unclassified Nocardia TaxID=2637762 RepID=UPI003627AA4A